jgi:hypothetical protein
MIENIYADEEMCYNRCLQIPLGRGTYISFRVQEGWSKTLHLMKFKVYINK